jgi:hypothetical protein
MTAPPQREDVQSRRRFCDATTCAAPPGAVRLAACRRCALAAGVRDAPAAEAEGDPTSAGKVLRATGSKVRATAARQRAAQLRRLRVASRLGLSLRCACLARLAAVRGSQYRPAVASSGGREAVRSRESRRQPRSHAASTSAAPYARRAWFRAAPPLVTAPADEGTRACLPFRHAYSLAPALTPRPHRRRRSWLPVAHGHGVGAV